MSKFNLAMLAISVAALSACGGGTSESRDEAPAARGTIVYGTLAGHATQAQIDAGTSASGLQPLSGKARCEVDVRYVYYITRDPAGQPTTASAGVLVPTGSDAACTGSRPVLLYAHGTATQKSYNLADVSNNREASLMMAMYAAQGFIVIAPNYLGYERSSLGFHPYLNAEAQAVDMVDGLRAGIAHLKAESGTKASDKLLISGYSQGGHVALATHKVIERDYGSEFKVTATAPMSGPYNLVGFADTVVNVQPSAGSTLFSMLLLNSYQKSYGNIYGSASEAYQAPFDATAETLLPTDTPIADLMAAGKLPADPTFARLFGTGGLLKDSFKASYASSNFRKALQANTLLGMNTRRPIALCGGKADPTVFFDINTPVTAADLKSRGVPVMGAYDLETLSTLPAGATGQTVYYGFQQAKAAAGSSVQAQYHGGLVPPFCNALARGFFQQVIAAGL